MQSPKKSHGFFSLFKKALHKLIKRFKSKPDNTKSEPQQTLIEPYTSSYADALQALHTKQKVPLQPLIQPIPHSLSHSSFLDMHKLFAPPQLAESSSSSETTLSRQSLSSLSNQNIFHNH